MVRKGRTSGGAMDFPRDFERIAQAGSLDEGPVRSALKERGRKFLDIDIKDMDPGTLRAEVQRLRAENLDILTTLTALQKGEDVSIPLINSMVTNRRDVLSNLGDIRGLARHLGEQAGFSSCYNQNEVIAIDPSINIEVGLAHGTIPPPPAGGPIGDGGAPSEPSAPSPGYQGQQMMGPLKLLKRPRILSTRQQHLGPDDYPGEVTYTSKRHPFKNSSKVLMDGKSIQCKLGIAARRMDALNQQVGGLETKIPSSDVMAQMSTDLKSFREVYDLVKFDFNFRDPTVWFKDIEGLRKSTPANLKSLQDRYTALSQSFSGMSSSLRDYIDTQMSSVSIPQSTWDGKIRSGVYKFDFGNLPSNNSSYFPSIDTWFDNHKISSMGNKSLKDVLSDNISGSNFKAAIDAQLKALDFKSDLTALRDSVGNIDTSLLDVKKKFNLMRNDTANNLSSIRSLAGSGSGLGLRGSVRDMLDKIKKKIDDIKTHGVTVIIWYKVESCLTAKVSAFIEIRQTSGLSIEASKTVSGKKLEKHTTKTYSNILTAAADVNAIASTIAGSANKECVGTPFLSSVLLLGDILPFASGDPLPVYYGKTVAEYLKKRLTDAMSWTTDSIKNKDLGLIDKDLLDINSFADISLPGVFTDLSPKLPSGWGTFFNKLP